MNEPAQLPASTEALIVGAGPVGFTLAASLAADGVPARAVISQNLAWRAVFRR